MVPVDRLRLIAIGLCAALLAASGCAIGWDEVDSCGQGGRCTPCASDDDCVTGASCCAKEVYCLHRQDSFAVCQLGCSQPDPPDCLCVASRCRFR